MLDDHRELDPPDPFPNSVVKRFFADGSVGFPHVRVGHRQAFNTKNPHQLAGGGFLYYRIGVFILEILRSVHRVITESGVSVG